MSLSDINNEFELTELDAWLINTILVGTTKLVCNFICENPLDVARSLSFDGKKRRVHEEALDIVKRMPDNRTFRRKELLEQLSEEQQGIQDADLSRILGSLNKIHLTEKDEGKIIEKKWGRPSLQNPYASDTPGPKVSHKLTGYFKNVRTLLKNQHKVKIIHSVLFHSGMLNRLVEHLEKISYGVIKLNNKYTAFKILRSHYMTSDNEKEFERYYNIIYLVSRRDMNILAEKRAQNYVKRRKAEDYIPIFENGSLYYFKVNKYEDFK